MARFSNVENDSFFFQILYEFILNETKKKTLRDSADHVQIILKKMLQMLKVC